MRIGIDFHSAENEGTGNCTYIRNLVEALVKTGPRNEYFLYVCDKGYPYYDNFKGKANVHLCSVPFRRPLARLALLGLMTFIDKLDIFHAQYVAPPLYKGKLVLAVHDVSFICVPQAFRPLERLRQRLLLPLSMRASDTILTISEHSRRDIVKFFDVDERKVEVAYIASSPAFRPQVRSREMEEITKAYGVAGKFILFVGRIDARKNLASLIKAFRMLKRVKQIPHKLVITGKEYYLPKYMKEEIMAGASKGDIVFTGYMSDEHLAVFFNMAETFVYPSLYEGFGLPCLEAMGCGCPVIASNNSSIPEVVGDAGLLVDPLDPYGIADAVYKVISNPLLQEKMRDRGLKQAKKFSWDKTAQRALEIFNKYENIYSRNTRYSGALRRI